VARGRGEAQFIREVVEKHSKRTAHRAVGDGRTHRPGTPATIFQTEAKYPTETMSDSASAPKRLAFFERYLTLWVLVCMVVGVVLGKLLPGVTSTLSKLEFGQGSQVNVPISILCG
jgi:hypothetical protein